MCFITGVFSQKYVKRHAERLHYTLVAVAVDQIVVRKTRFMSLDCVDCVYV